ncbi:MAG: FAD-dependent thymidylate synthase [Simkaniaceae bacterium]|nr:FAD-dependent thymidylate synthase [Simkaniaceae bacterium]
MIDNYEEFSEQQVKLLEKFVTSTTGSIFVLRNLPEVIKGALFSRYSRSSLGLRSLLLKEFILNDETAFQSIVGGTDENGEQFVAIKKAQNFYDRILDGYGDDSIGELGGAHLAVENVSMLAAKEIEDCRIGGSPLEKSTRYVYFDQKVNGEYLFYREPILMTSAFRDAYVDVCNLLFDTYGKIIPPLTEYMEKKFPKEEGVSKGAYTAAIRAKVLDCLRGLLPAATMTNMGVYGNGRFYETLIQKLNCHNLSELQEIGKKSYEELSKVIPSFIRRSESNHKYQNTFTKFKEAMKERTKTLVSALPEMPAVNGPMVQMVNHDPEGPVKLAAALLFASSNQSLEDLQAYCKQLPVEELHEILDAAAVERDNRRHKSPRALEHVSFTFSIVSDFGCYRDLHRHRTLTQERQLLTCDADYFVPEEIVGTPMEKLYRHAMDEAKKVYDSVAEELPEEAQYVVPMGYNVHWYFHINLRALQWLTELRSQAAGHPTYRYIAQEMASQVIKAYPEYKRYLEFVDFDGYDLGRLGQEIRTEEKLKARMS